MAQNTSSSLRVKESVDENDAPDFLVNPVINNYPRRQIFGDNNIYDVYRQLFVEMTEQIEHKDFFVASDKEWRLKIYFQLVEGQRELAKKMVSDSWLEQQTELQEKPWSSDELSCETPNPSLKRKCRLQLEEIDSTESEDNQSQTPWNFDDFLKSAKILHLGSIRTIQFSDDEEMRRVYTLLFDVLRFKKVLSQTLIDIFFFDTYPELVCHESIIWLFLYDLQARKFIQRDDCNLSKMNELMEEEKYLNKIEESLWNNHVKLAAAMTRIRIKNCANSINDLIPNHLQNQRLSRAVQPISCWTNTLKIESTESFLASLEDYQMHDHLLDTILRFNEYSLDSHCENLLMFHYKQRATISTKKEITNQLMVIQDKSFCIGPAMFTKLLKQNDLTGHVVCTHLTSIRATVYLCALLSKNKKIKVHVFGAEQRKLEYELYLNAMGVTNCLIYSEKLLCLSPESDFLENVVAVFANPPNSCSAVNDPIDMICNQSGDLDMIEMFAESDVTMESKKRITTVLEEQQATLKFLLSKPQIQFVLYETHSLIDSENIKMVEKVIHEINQNVRIHHLSQQKTKRAPKPKNLDIETGAVDVLEDEITEVEDKGTVDEKDINNNEADTVNQNVVAVERELENDSEESAILETVDDKTEKTEKTENSLAPWDLTDQLKLDLENVNVPPCDLFEMSELPDLCVNDDGCLDFSDAGCYLALIKRKEITKLDEKFMIEVAEERGLFGTESAKPVKEKVPVKEEIAPIEEEEEMVKPKKKIKREIKLDRIISDTHTSLLKRNTRCQKDKPFITHSYLLPCPRYCKSPAPIRPILWWREAFKHINEIRKSVIRKQLMGKPIVEKKTFELRSETLPSSFEDQLNNNLTAHPQLLNLINDMNGKMGSLDVISLEACLLSRKFPKLQLSRLRRKNVPKIPVPTHICQVKWPKGKSKLIRTM